MSLEAFSQDARFIVLGVVRGIEQGHRTIFHEVAQALDRLAVGGELSPITPRECGEPGRVMTEPSPEFVARGNILQPSLRTPRGHNRSTSTRAPSLPLGGSYILFTRMSGAASAIFFPRPPPFRSVLLGRPLYEDLRRCAPVRLGNEVASRFDASGEPIP